MNRLIGLRIACLAITVATSALLSAPAFAGQLAGQLKDATFSRTAQSDAVVQLIETMRAGKLDDFRALLQGEALNLYGTEKGMHELLERFEKLSGNAGAQEINVKTHLEAALRPDTLIFSNHAYSVDVMRSAQDAPIWNVSVNCMNLILFESLGTPEKHCQIGMISTSERRDGEAEGRNFAAARSNVTDKQLGGEVLAPSAIDNRAPAAASLAN